MSGQVPFAVVGVPPMISLTPSLSLRRGGRQVRFFCSIKAFVAILMAVVGVRQQLIQLKRTHPKASSLLTMRNEQKCKRKKTLKLTTAMLLQHRTPQKLITYNLQLITYNLQLTTPTAQKVSPTFSPDLYKSRGALLKIARSYFLWPSTNEIFLQWEVGQ